VQPQSSELGYIAVSIATDHQRIFRLKTRKKRPTTPEIYQLIRQSIIDFDLFPGSRITETELAEQFGVSRTPIREALQRLEVEGLVRIRAKQGCFIRPVDTAVISNYYDVRIAIESMAVELACKNMPKESIQALSQFWNPKNFKDEQDYSNHIQQIEESFHVQLAEGSGNPILVQYLKDINNHIRVIRRLGFPDKKSVRETYSEHFEICNLILTKKTNEAKKAIANHIRKSQGIASSVTLAQLQQHKLKSKKKSKLLTIDDY